ncbi:MAG: DmsC/YnfH family molybdoenzyme membrane anchor subunit, partial [Bryobacteraceae bacterium]
QIAGAAGAFAGMLYYWLPGREVADFATALAGLAGVTCSARIYIVPARPAWFSGYTVAEFFSTALLLGPAFVRMLDPRVPEAVLLASVAGGAAQLIVQSGKFLWLSQSEMFELRSSSVLLAGRLRPLFVTRLLILIVAGIVIPTAGASPSLMRSAFLAALGGELLGRYLFFVSVVPKNIAAAFTGSRRAA